ncbi:cytochrome P450 [Streptomyces tsukubensis]|uniref:Cytochrome P450 n=1 Tax=Streptomyces tsukubensis TaxID=83656 RepID=A0A1V4AGR9_9ACTN|nr:cytochrome P450 [Streptomyces tsukubensis]OON82633.1 hypothetical protein B1H18_00765 [Streptomyces tsukubensis]QFR92195.1 cytochrome P450 [Streptomyces tsukubensis]
MSGAAEQTRTQESLPVYPFGEWGDRLSPWYARLCVEEAAAHRVRTLNGDTVWLVTRHAVARAVLADPRMSLRAAGTESAPRQQRVRFCPAGGAGTPGPFFDDPVLRTVVQQALSPREVRARTAAVTSAAHRFFAALGRRPRGERETDWNEGIVRPLSYRLTGRLLFGELPDSVRDELRAAFQVGLTFHGHPDTAVRAAWDKFHAVLADWYADPAHLAGDHLMARLARAAGEAVDPAGLAAMAGPLWCAGHEASVGFLTNILPVLDGNPELRAALRASEASVPRITEELLRVTPLVTGGAPRVAMEDAVIAGIPVKRGECVVVSYEAANRDPRAFPDPERPEPRRAGPGHLAFGHGPHRCPGQHLARLEIDVVLRAIRVHTPGLRPAVPVGDVRWRSGSVVRTPHALPVVW